MAGDRYVVGNRDRCGRCKTRHGGNDHLCPVHGTVSRGCCESAAFQAVDGAARFLDRQPLPACRAHALTRSA